MAGDRAPPWTYVYLTQPVTVIVKGMTASPGFPVLALYIVPLGAFIVVVVHLGSRSGRVKWRHFCHDITSCDWRVRSSDPRLMKFFHSYLTKSIALVRAEC